MLDQFNTFLDEQLNAEQKKAVTQATGNLLVIAGAGSGKTRVITARITNLILNEDVDPSSIVALTFTNKAAKEMKERIKKFLGSDIRLPFVGTFHSYCLQWLKIVYPTSFSIMDSDDQYKILSQIITRNNLKKFITARQATYHISNIKNQIICGADPSTIDSTMLEVYKQYEAEKSVSNCLDFDDLLIEVLKLFRSNAAFKTQFQSRLSHILIDEYQDTSVVQHELLKEMAKDGKTVVADSVCIVGDEDQSIYSWRGATIDNIMNFKKDFPRAKTIKIEQNYRSAQQILDTAHSVIENNVKRNPKKLWSDKKGKDRVHQLSCASGYQEADSIAWLLQALPKDVALNQVAILYRTHFQSRSIEESLIKQSIPYTIIGGIQFYERKEIKDLIAYLRVIVNPFDRIALMRIINCPKRGLGQKFEEELLELWNSEPLLDFRQILKEVSTKQPPSKQESIRNFLGIFHELTPEMTPDEAIDKILRRSMYHFYLKEEYDNKEAETKIDNTHEFIRAAEHFVQQGMNTISQMLTEIALMQEKMTKDSKKGAQVQLMTLHAAKGLEFHTVVIAGVEEGLLPSTRSLESMDDIEEERRLCYVGIT
ncbi:MAG TPA: UvrD-helicase domain-containing protein, partial [Candidatus Babeliales bacterium]|nr:UvrD-helicase domain-containing protein [Candidatus Babeliales bacterium]